MDNASPRFHIELTPDMHGWEAVVYDFADHGPNLPYATVSGPTLAGVLDQASHYVIVAE